MTTPAPKKISELTLLDGSNLAGDDYVVVIDKSSIVEGAPSPEATKRSLLSGLKSFFVPSEPLSVFRSTVSTIADGVAEDIDITNVAQAYVITSIQTNVPAWVVVYNSGTSRTEDSSRTETTDPLPGSGVIAEVITTTNPYEQIITPGVIGWTADSNIPIKVVNKSGSDSTVTVTLKVIPLTSS